MINSIEDCLKILELNTTANWNEVVAAYRELLKIWHPDKYLQDEKLKSRAEKKTKEIIEAFKTLKPHYRKTELINSSVVNLSKSILNTKKDLNFTNSHPKVKKQYVVNQNLSFRSLNTKTCFDFLEQKKEKEAKFVRYMGFIAACSFFGIVSAIGFPDIDNTLALKEQHTKEINVDTDYLLLDPKTNKEKIIKKVNTLERNSSKIKY